tara:strand:+ start:2747 stop:4162 length:1416 start_codon:yes stop_codon:yes gene_type:complete
MKTLQEQYNQIQKGEGRKDLFLKEAKSKYPNLVSNLTSFSDAEKILKSKNVINEELGGVVTLKPVNTLTSEDFNPNKEAWENKFANYLAEAGKKSLNPIVNTEVEKKENDKAGDEKIKAEEKETAKEVINTQDRNYDYSPKVDNINNVNAQEMMNGVYCEIKADPNLSLEEAQAKAIKNLAKDSLHYVKEGQFGVEGLGYEEQKVEESSGKTYGGSGYSDKVKEGKADMVPVKESKEDKLKSLIKESLGGVVTTGNPNSLAAMSGEIIKNMMNEDEWQQQVGSQYHKDLYAEENKEEDLPMDEAEKPDFIDIDGDGDKEESMKKAAKDKKAKKPKKESIDSKLAEIGKEGDIVKMEAQLDYLSEFIQEKVDRVASINEDENLQELIDKAKMKQMQREIKLLEKKKAKMEKLYEKMCGKKYARKEMVDEVEEIDESFDDLVDKIEDQGKSEEDAKKIAGAINRDYVGNYRDE